jgi:hypothetical protein
LHYCLFVKVQARRGLDCTACGKLAFLKACSIQDASCDSRQRAGFPASCALQSADWISGFASRVLSFQTSDFDILSYAVFFVKTFFHFSAIFFGVFTTSCGSPQPKLLTLASRCFTNLPYLILNVNTHF